MKIDEVKFAIDCLALLKNDNIDYRRGVRDTIDLMKKWSDLKE